MNCVRKFIRLMCFGGLLLVMLTSLRSTSADDDCPKTEEIVQRHTDWKNSFTSIRMVFVKRFPRSLSKGKHEDGGDPDVEGFDRQIEWVLTDGGWLRHTTKMHAAGHLTRMRIVGDDGRNFFVAEFNDPAVENKIPAVLSLGASRIAAGQSGHPDSDLEPLELIRVATWWLDLRDRKIPPVVLRCEEVDGRHCAVIRQPDDGNEIVWLDLDHDALPFRAVSDVPRFEVDEFLQMGNGHWFPKRGITVRDNESEETCIWNVQEVSLNEDHPQSLFAPPQVGIGTILRMLRDDGVESGHPESADTRPLDANPRGVPSGSRQWNKSRGRIIVATLSAAFLIAVGYVSAWKSRK